MIFISMPPYSLPFTQRHHQTSKPVLKDCGGGKSDQEHRTRIPYRRSTPVSMVRHVVLPLKRSGFLSRMHEARRSKKVDISNVATMCGPSAKATSMMVDGSTIPAAYAGASRPDRQVTVLRKKFTHWVPSWRRPLPIVSKTIMYPVTISDDSSWTFIVLPVRSSTRFSTMLVELTSAEAKVTAVR